MKKASALICTPKVGRRPTLGVHYLTKFNAETRIRAIQLLEDGLPVRAVARELGVGHNTVRNWHNRYQAGGRDQLLKTHHHYTAKFKLEAITYRRENELSYPQAAADLCIPNESTLYVWEKLYEEQGIDGLQDTRKGRPPTMSKQEKPKQPMTREQELETENARLRMENAYLKKLKALVEEREKSAKKTK